MHKSSSPFFWERVKLAFPRDSRCAWWVLLIRRLLAVASIRLVHFLNVCLLVLNLVLHYILKFTVIWTFPFGSSLLRNPARSMLLYYIEKNEFSWTFSLVPAFNVMRSYYYIKFLELRFFVSLVSCSQAILCFGMKSSLPLQSASRATNLSLIQIFIVFEFSFGCLSWPRLA